MSLSKTIQKENTPFSRWSPKGHSTVDIMGCGKLIAEKILFRVESQAFAKAKASLRVSVDKFPWIAADSFLEIHFFFLEFFFTWMECCSLEFLRKMWTSRAIALFTVTFFHLHYNVFEHGCEAISGNFALLARNCLTSTFKNNIVMQMRKVNCEKGYCLDLILIR